MGNTPIYGFGYIEPNQDLSENIDLDELRFKAIENQIYNLYQIFKNGVLEDDPNTPSWRIKTFSNEFKTTKIQITSGKGHVSYKYATTASSKDVTLPTIPANVSSTRLYVYAYENSDTSVTGDVDFVASLTQINDTVNYIFLGQIDVDVINGLIAVDDSGRQDISLFASLSSLLTNHKHVGGSNNPSPVDLSKEVKNLLSSDNIDYIDASKITTGVLDSSRLPEISHDTLQDKGNLTHTELETLLLDIVSEDTTYTLSDLSIANRLQMLVALKKSGGAGMTYIDSSQINTLVYVPGIFPNNFSNASTGNTANFAQKTSVPSAYTLADIRDTSPRNSGSGISGSVISSAFVGDKSFVVLNDFLSAKTTASSLGSSINYFNNISISGSATTGSFTLDTPLNYRSFNGPVSSIFDSANNWNSGLVFTTSFSSNKVKVDTKMYTYTLFDQPLSLESASRIGIGFSSGLGETTAALGNIYMFLVVGSGNTDPGLLYDQKIEFAPNTSGAGTSIIYISPVDNVKIFDDTVTGMIAGTSAYKNILLSDFGDSSLKKSVHGYGFYFATNNGWNAEKQVKFELLTPSESDVNSSGDYDDLILERRAPSEVNTSVFVWNDEYKYKSGSFLLRFDSGDTTTQYNLVEFDVDQPAGSKYTIQTRSNTNSDVFYNLKTVSTSDVIQATPDVNSNQGRYLDVLFNLYSTQNQDLAPIVNSLRINYSASGSATTRTYDRNTTDISLQKFGWISDAYYNKNVGYGTTNPDDTNYLKIFDTSSVGNWIYLRNNSLISAANNTSESTIEDGIDNSTLRNYLTPTQVFLKTTSYGFNSPSDYQALSTGGNVICDTKNDRVIVTDIDGNFTKVIQGNIRLKLQSRDFVALSATFNPTTRKIFLAFSQNISFVDLTKIYIIFDGTTVRADDVRIDGSYSNPIFSLSATYELKIKDTVEGLALVSAIQNATNRQVRLDKNCFVNSGNSINGTDPLSAVIPESTVSTINRTQQFYAGISTSVTGTQTITTGLSTTNSTVNDVTDFNSDSAISTTVMYGPNNQSDTVLLDLLVGPIYFENIYNPISVQYHETDSLLVIAQSHSDAVICFSDDDILTRKWQITSDVAKFYDNKLGSAYLMNSGNVLLGCPAFDAADTGKLLVYNISNGFIETKLTFNNDVVKALPGPATDYSNFYVLTDDVINNGQNSRLHLINTSGNILSTWGDNNEIFHPKGMKIISNDNILISE
jgi:hypothetical protein